MGATANQHQRHSPLVADLYNIFLQRLRHFTPIYTAGGYRSACLADAHDRIMVEQVDWTPAELLGSNSADAVESEAAWVR